MRLAILADIHGNVPAFEAALDHIAGQNVDQIVIAGDIVVGSPDSAECWRIAKSLGCPMLRGNHERYIAHYGTPQAPAIWSAEQYTPVQWAVAQFTAEERVEMGKLPLMLRLEGAPDLLLVHASARNDYDTVTMHTPEEELEAMFAGVSERYIVRAHNHVARTRLWGDKLIISNGSVGLPLDGYPTAQYLLAEQHAYGWHFHHQSVPYDVDATLRRFEETGYIEATGPMGALFLRELATATQHFVPFLRAYGRWSAEGAITLDAALERFLGRGY